MTNGKQKHMNPEERDIDKLRKRFPSARARWAADEASDKVPETAPIHVLIDTWIAAYRAAGGKEKVYEE